MKMRWFWSRENKKMAAAREEDAAKGAFLMGFIQLGAKVETLFQQRNWGESGRYVQANPDLLSPQVEEIFDDMVKMQSDPRMVTTIEQHRKFLRDCREQGLAATMKQFEDPRRGR
jgi:hypothetical protein